MEKPLPLHVLVARALGWIQLEAETWNLGDRTIDRGDDAWRGTLLATDPKGAVHFERSGRVPRYDTDWSETGPLIEKLRIRMDPLVLGRDGPAVWNASWYGDGPYNGITSGGYDAPLEAVCHLILELHAAGKLRKPGGHQR